jgi:GDP/GTP exchange factor required for growth at low temperature
MSNFNTLVAIIAGLRSELVNRAMHRFWNRVGMWEIRMLNDLKVYTSHSDDFMHVRRTVDAIADAKPLDVSSRAASVVSTSGTDSKGKIHSEAKLPIPSACIPFIGQLPHFIVFQSHVDIFVPCQAFIYPSSADTVSCQT